LGYLQCENSEQASSKEDSSLQVKSNIPQTELFGKNWRTNELLQCRVRVCR